MRSPEPYTAADGTRTWKIRFRHYGKQTSETFGTEREALDFARVLAGAGPVGALAWLNRKDVEAASRTTLDELAEQFFAYKATRVRSDRTVADYRRDYRNWISPLLGTRAARGVLEPDVQQLVDLMAAKLSPKSVADRHAILFGIYKWASAPSRRLVEHNPCVGTDLPKRRKGRPKGLRPAEWHALYLALVPIDPDAADLADFLLATGWRWSEGAALDIFDVEDDGRVVHVNMGRVVRRNAAGQHVIVEDAKSDAGARRIMLDADCATMVRRRIGGKISGLVFTNASGNQWHYANFLNRCWKPAVKAAGLTERAPSPHWLRHTHVAWMVMGGQVSLPEIQSRIGHESISTTIGIYGRMISDVSADALDGFAAMRRVSPPELRQLEG